MDVDRPDMSVWRGVSAVLVFAALFECWLILRPATPDIVRLVDDLANAVGPLAVVLWFALATRRLPGTRRRTTARLLIAGAASFGGGQLIWTWYEQVLNRPTPFPSVADVGYLGAQALVLAGILMLPDRLGTLAGRTRVLLNGLLVMVAAGTASWYFVLGPTVLAAAVSWAAFIVSTAYPFSTLLLVSCLLLLGARSSRVVARRAIPVLGAALAVTVIANSAYDYQLLHGTYRTGELLDPLWALGWMLVGVAAIIMATDAPEKQQEVAGEDGATSTPLPLSHLWRSLLPYALVPIMLALLVYASITPADMRLRLGVYLGVAGVVALILLHQILVVLENVAINRRLDQFWRLAAAEEALRGSEQRFRQLIDGLHVGVFLVGCDGRIILSNATALDMLAISVEVESEGPHFNMTGGPDAFPAERALAEAVATRRPVWNVITVARDRGAQPPMNLLADAIPQLSPSGEVEHVILTLTNITERHQAEDALRSSEAQFRTIFNAAPIGLGIADMKGNFVQTNRAYQEMLGYSAEEFRHVHWTDISHPDDVAGEEELDERLVSGEIDRYQLEKREIRKDGTLIWVRQTVTEVWDNGEPQFAICMMEDISGQKQAQEALVHQARHDALTDLPNRVLLGERLEQATVYSRREGASVALLIMDLDRFKDINDSFGHLFGDSLLQQLGARLQTALRQSDTVARLGGDEFAVLLPGTDEQGALHAAGKILELMAEPFTIEGQAFDVEASVGIALYPQHADNAQALLRLADVAMYVAKRANSGYALYSLEQDQNSPARLMLLGELRAAMERDQLVLHYQPKLDLRTGRVESVEALVRWAHPVHGLLAPWQFIPLAEHTGLIRPLDEWVLTAALAQCARWNALGLVMCVGVNLSVRHLQDPDFEDRIARTISRMGVDAGQLIIEVTESVVMADPDIAMQILTRLHDRGVRVAIDDFGTGYSSLAYLQRLPVDEIKIDKSFVLNMAANEGDSVIARAVIDLGHNLNLRVVAEGVENAQVLRRLREMGCDLGQGFYLGRPVSAAELEPELLARLDSCSA